MGDYPVTIMIFPYFLCIILSSGFEIRIFMFATSPPWVYYDVLLRLFKCVGMFMKYTNKISPNVISNISQIFLRMLTVCALCEMYTVYRRQSESGPPTRA